MKNIKNYIYTIFFVVVTNSMFAQIKLSESSSLSILTIGPGSSLNDSFGHSAIRVYDSNQKIDIVFDYGRYDFNADGFYINFIKGKLNYEIGWSYYNSLIAYYKTQNRSIYEQKLNLPLKEKQKFLDKLLQRIEPANKRYSYDFFYNNCATKIKDDLINITKNNITFSIKKDSTLKTFRQLIRSHVPQNSWGGIGIDLALGSVVDKKATVEEHTFLPNYLRNILDESILMSSSQKLISKTNTINEIKNKNKINLLFSPLFIMSFLSILVLIITYFDMKYSRRTKSLDFFIFLLTGLLGILIFFLWFATDHSTTAFNYNFLWAFAFNILFIPIVLKSEIKKKFINYLKLLVLMLILILIHWITGIQSFNYCLIPLFFALILRYLYVIDLIRKINK